MIFCSRESYDERLLRIIVKYKRLLKIASVMFAARLLKIHYIILNNAPINNIYNLKNQLLHNLSMSEVSSQCIIIHSPYRICCRSLLLFCLLKMYLYYTAACAILQFTVGKEFHLAIKPWEQQRG